MSMPNRNQQADYRYGYQGEYAEKEELGGTHSFELRLWDARIGRWMSPDPYGQFYSPYLGMGNAPHQGVDPNGGYYWPPDEAGAFDGYIHEDSDGMWMWNTDINAWEEMILYDGDMIYFTDLSYGNVNGNWSWADSNFFAHASLLNTFNSNLDNSICTIGCHTTPNMDMSGGNFPNIIQDSGSETFPAFWSFYSGHSEGSAPKHFRLGDKLNVMNWDEFPTYTSSNGWGKALFGFSTKFNKSVNEVLKQDTTLTFRIYDYNIESNTNQWGLNSRTIGKKDTTITIPKLHLNYYDNAIEKLSQERLKSFHVY